MKLQIVKHIALSLFLAGCIINSGCMKLVLRASSDLFTNIEASFFEECDPDLAEKAFPSELKLLEGLLKHDPGNPMILNSLCKGFYGYSMLFVEDIDSERASNLYLRARDYGISALKDKGAILLNATNEDIDSIFENIDSGELETLLWVTIAWSSWINLNLDKPVALAQLGTAQSCLDIIVTYNPEYMHGLPYILMGTSLSSVPPMFGGNTSEAKQYFEKALESSDRNFFMAHYFYAKNYAVQVQDRTLFDNLIDEILSGDSQTLKDVCLLNSVIKSKTLKLRDISDELFI